MRHSHANFLIHSGELSVLDVSHRLGHSNPNITLSEYTHFYHKKDSKMMCLLDDLQKEHRQNIVNNPDDMKKALK